jgi:hypothetical protein
VTPPRGEGPRPKLFSADTKLYPLMAEPNKAAGRSWAGGALVPAGRRAERSKTGRSGSWPLTCVRALMTRSDRLGALIATGKQRPEPNPANQKHGLFHG